MFSELNLFFGNNQQIGKKIRLTKGNKTKEIQFPSN